MPTTVEYAPVLECNVRCPGCPYAYPRRDLGGPRIGRAAFAEANDTTVSTRATARRVLEASREAGAMGVLWTGGGEPLLFEPLVDMVRYCASLGMVSALYTNGVMFAKHPALARDLLAPASEMVFIRVSISAISADVVRRHWGVRDPEDILPQIDGLKRLFAERDDQFSRYQSSGSRIPAIQVSTIVDAANLPDLLNLCNAVAAIVREASHHEDGDAMVVRPMTDHHSWTYRVRAADEEIAREIVDRCGPEGEGFRTLKEAGMPLALGFGLDRIAAGKARSYKELVEAAYADRDWAWSIGLFLTVGPDGGVYMNTEHNCDPLWRFGSLKENSVAEIYAGGRRRQLMDLVHAARLGPGVFEPNTRSARLDRIARAIQAGAITQPEIDRLRRAATEAPPLVLS
jgi:uncharacterized Fe-S cluster-containing radical SAM superfamily protein